MSRYFLRSKGSENLNIPSFVVMPHQGTPSNYTEGQEEQMQNLHQEKDLEIAALRERIGEERRRQVDKDDELEALTEQLRHMERQRDKETDRRPAFTLLVYYNYLIPTPYPKLQID